MLRTENGREILILKKNLLGGNAVGSGREENNRTWHQATFLPSINQGGKGFAAFYTSCAWERRGCQKEVSAAEGGKNHPPSGLHRDQCSTGREV